MSLFAPFYIEDEKFKHLNSWIQEQTISSIFILVDENTHSNCLPQLLSAVEPLQRVEIVEIPSGEENKTIEIATQLWSSLTELKADRNAVLINLGGGVITDLGGFVASCYKRGIRFINIPTTLLAMVDAAHGGKTGVDFDGFKNQIGVFNKAEATFIHGDFCSTLPWRQFISGFAECVKHALIADKSLWQTFLMNGSPDPGFWEMYVEPSLKIKQGIVEADPTEKGPRKILNFGHTVGHAIESYSLEHDKPPLLHGEAIAMGMIAELYLSTHFAGLSEADLHIAVEYLSAIFPLRLLEEKNFDQIINIILHDKKNSGSIILCSLINEPGTSVFDIAIDELRLIEALAYLNQVTKKQLNH